jgi:hypothetical protein
MFLQIRGSFSGYINNVEIRKLNTLGELIEIWNSLKFENFNVTWEMLNRQMTEIN